MNAGLGAGAEDDPFADDSDASEQSDSTSDTDAAGNPGEEDDLFEQTSDGRPYLDRRDGAKDERRLVQFFLRDAVYSETNEDRLRLDVTDALSEKPGKFDLREALVAVAQNHEEEVVDELRRMGY